MFQRLYDRVLMWAGHRHASRYLAGLSFAEATFFPVPPDVMLAPMVLARRDRAWSLALLTTIASVVGALAGYLIGWLALELVFPLLERTGQVQAYEAAVDAFQRYGVWFVIVVGFTPIPFKLITIAAGALLMPFPAFVAGCLVGRAARFFLVAGLILLGGERFAQGLRRRVDAIGWGVIGVLLIAMMIYLLVR
ncbi:MAG: YqaA family protein [Wenzhouxiangellaceae bacterium]